VQDAIEWFFDDDKRFQLKIALAKVPEPIPHDVETFKKSKMNPTISENWIEF